jgi:hypothetical protein
MQLMKIIIALGVVALVAVAQPSEAGVRKSGLTVLLFSK